MKSIIILFLVSFSSFVSAQIATKQWDLNLNASGNHNLLYESNSIYVTGEGGIGFSMEGNGGEHLFWVSNSGVLLFKKTFSEGQVYVNHVTSNAMSYTLRLRPAEGENYEKYKVNFGRVDIKIYSLDWLYLIHSGHRRAKFIYDKEISMVWIAP